MNQAITYQVDPLLQVLNFSAMGFVMPLLGFVLLSLFSLKEKTVWYVAIFTLVASFFSLVVFLKPLVQSHQYFTISWFQIAQSNFQVTLLMDDTCFWVLTMIHLVTLMVVLFSGYYMKAEQRIEKYFAYILLFFTAMVALVMVNNLMVSYIFWELVGFASYALIGFWRTKESAILANKKAFIINRIGDLGFLVAIFILYNQFATLNLQSIEVLVQQSPNNTTSLYWASAAILIAIIAKSAQFPFHVWLPDAMEGPTPVSALIHAATMVIAGVYLLLRISFLFPLEVLLLLKYLSLFSILMGSIFAMVQNDIKKILAYSTISQIGFMLFAISIGNNQLALFHLLTHAFFKAALFLAAGAFIHENKSQDIRLLKGVSKQMPLVFYAYTVASAALIGFPFTAAYLSKEGIVYAAFSQSGINITNVLLVVSVLLTSIYVSRMWFHLNADKTATKLQSNPLAMLLPILILSIASLFFIFSINPFHLESVWLAIKLDHVPFVFSLGMIAMSLFGVLLVKYSPVILNPNESNRLVLFLQNGAYIDQLYEMVFVKPILKLAAVLKWLDRHVVDALVDGIAKLAITLAKISDWFDRKVIDGFVNLIALIAKRFGDLIRISQTGRVQTYFLLALMMMAILAWFIY